MEEWTAYYINNPDDDYNLVVEIYYKEKDVAFISKGKDGLELKWYSLIEDMVVPADWLSGLLNNAKVRLK